MVTMKGMILKSPSIYFSLAPVDSGEAAAMREPAWVFAKAINSGCRRYHGDHIVTVLHTMRGRDAEWCSVSVSTALR